MIKKFIKIAQLCGSYNNFNSMFAVISGLGSAPVTRLKQVYTYI